MSNLGNRIRKNNLLWLLLLAGLAGGVIFVGLGSGNPGTIAFTTESITENGINTEVWIMSASGTNARKLTNHSAMDETPSFSPDGEKIAFVSSRDDWRFAIYIMDFDGNIMEKLPSYPCPKYTFTFLPRWSPDGTQFAFMSIRNGNSEVCVMDLDGSNEINLSRNPWEDTHPSWSPDGRKIVFTSDRDGNGQIYVVDSDGTNLKRLTSNTFWDGPPAWSPDGRKIAFTSDREGNSEVYVMNVDGSNQKNLTNNSAADGGPIWSPDGRKIAFTSERDGNYEIYVMDTDGSNQRRLTRSLTDELASSWCCSSPPATGCLFIVLTGIFLAGIPGILWLYQNTTGRYQKQVHGPTVSNEVMIITVLMASLLVVSYLDRAMTFLFSVALGFVLIYISARLMKIEDVTVQKTLGVALIGAVFSTVFFIIYPWGDLVGYALVLPAAKVIYRTTWKKASAVFVIYGAVQLVFVLISIGVITPFSKEPIESTALETECEMEDSDVLVIESQRTSEGFLVSVTIRNISEPPVEVDTIYANDKLLEWGVDILLPGKSTKEIDLSSYEIASGSKVLFVMKNGTRLTFIVE